jgi:hypothetical protein
MGYYVPHEARQIMHDLTTEPLTEGKSYTVTVADAEGEPGIETEIEVVTIDDRRSCWVMLNDTKLMLNMWGAEENGPVAGLFNTGEKIGVITEFVAIED